MQTTIWPPTGLKGAVKKPHAPLPPNTHRSVRSHDPCSTCNTTHVSVPGQALLPLPKSRLPTPMPLSTTSFFCEDKATSPFHREKWGSAAPIQPEREAAVTITDSQGPRDSRRPQGKTHDPRQPSHITRTTGSIPFSFNDIVTLWSWLSVVAMVKKQGMSENQCETGNCRV